MIPPSPGFSFVFQSFFKLLCWLLTAFQFEFKFCSVLGLNLILLTSPPILNFSLDSFSQAHRIPYLVTIISSLLCYPWSTRAPKCHFHTAATSSKSVHALFWVRPFRATVITCFVWWNPLEQWWSPWTLSQKSSQWCTKITHSSQRKPIILKYGIQKI